MVGISFILFCFSLIIRRLYLNEVHPLSLAFFNVRSVAATESFTVKKW